MARFEFRLTALLSLRRTRRDACRAELASALVVERELAMRYRALGAELERERTQARAGTKPGRLCVEALQDAARYQAAVRRALEQAAADHQTAARQVEHCQQSLAAADAECRALEKLRERQLDEFLRAQARRDAVEADQAACPIRPRC